SGGDDGFVGLENDYGGGLVNNVGNGEVREIPSTLKGRGLGRDSNIRSGGDSVETVEFGLGYKVEISVGSVLDNVPTSDENGSDIKARKRLNSEEKRERESSW
ncbi:hypothetical protein U1Q18_007071, partial [Sarracenia purpurea var. burkii]